MGAVSVTCSRTIGRARNLFMTALATGCFLFATAVFFAFRLEWAEGGSLSAVEVWASCAAQLLPLYVAFLGMDVWSEERRSGRLDVLLATAVRERDFVLGKFFGLWLLTAGGALLSLVLSLSVLQAFAPAAVVRSGFLASLPAFAGLLLQGGLWCSVAVAVSALFCNSAASLFVTLLLTVGLPRGVWLGLMSWSSAGRISYGQMPLDAQVLDAAAGIFSVGTVVGTLACALAALFVAAKFVAFARMAGRGARLLRLSTVVAVALAVAAAALTVALCARIDLFLDVPVVGSVERLTPRTRSILAESSGDVSVTCLLSRKDPRFRTTSRFLRLLQRESAALGGARFILQYVDPHWDIGAAERLLERGVAESGLVFESGRRTVSLAFKDGCGERACATAVRRLVAVPRRRNVYWTTGHGESETDDYGVFGLSDIARDLSHGGYANRKMDLMKVTQIPGDCALVVVAGAKDAFSRVELERLENYLKEGGRLLVLLGRDPNGGVNALLPAWGLRLVADAAWKLPTVSGSDVIVSEFSDHPIAEPLKGTRILLEKPVGFVASAAAEAGKDADRIDYAPVAGVGDVTFAAAVERGSGAGADLAIRPTRIVAIGDATFVMNGPLASRANANRDFFLNCATYLSGAGVIGAAGDENERLVSGMDRRRRFEHLIWSAAVFPGLVVLVMTVVVIRRRRRL